MSNNQDNGKATKAAIGDASAMRKALIGLVDYLNNEVKRTSKCNRCRYKGKSFHGEPCYWHVDCGIEEYDKEASDIAMYLLRRFKLQKALDEPPRNCNVGTAEEQTTRYKKFCSAHKYLGSDFSYMCKGFGKERCPFFNSHTKSQCEFAWSKMPYKEGESDGSK